MKEKFLILLLLILAIWPVLPLHTKGLLTSHDAEGHVVRLSEFHDALMDGQFPVRWAKRLNFGLGYPVFDFNYPLPYYFGEIFHLAGFSLVDSVKFLFALAYIVSGLTMFWWLKTRVTMLPAFMGAIFYLYAPYRFVDLYVRGALGEHLSFVFLPLCFLGIDKIFQNEKIKWMAFLAINFALLILSHNIMAMIFSAILMVYLLGKTIVRKSWRLGRLGILGILGGLMLTAYFWVPALYDRQYTNLDVLMSKEYIGHFVAFKDLLYSKWGFGVANSPEKVMPMSLQLGIPQWAVMAIIAIIIVIKVITIIKARKKPSLSLFPSLFFLIFAGVVFLMLPQAKFVWDNFSGLQLIQFPWRLLAVGIFCAAVLAAEVFIIIKRPSLKFLGAVFFTVLLLYANRNHWRPNLFFEWRDWWQETRGYFGTTTMANEHQPKWQITKGTLPYTQSKIVEGEGEIKDLVWRSNYHEFLVEVKSEVLFQDRTVYFPGWTMIVDGQQATIDYQSPESGGLMTIKIPKGQHRIISRFKETPVRQMADILSLGTGILIMGWSIIQLRRMVKF